MNNYLQINKKILVCPECKDGEIVCNIIEENLKWKCDNRLCGITFPILFDVPVLFDRITYQIHHNYKENNGNRCSGMSDLEIINNSIYNWSNLFPDIDKDLFNKEIDYQYHIDAVSKAIPDLVFEGKVLEIGTGTGFDGRKISRKNPKVEYYGIDIGETIYLCNHSKNKDKNQKYVRASVLSLPFKDNTFDIVYSYGVFHHTPNPILAFTEALRVLKKGGKLCFYVYEKHESNLLKRIPLEIFESLHLITRRLSYRQLKILCYIMSPVVLLFLSYPAQIMKKISLFRNVGLKFPYHHGTIPKSIIGDLLDRFGASINYRFSECELKALLIKNNIKKYILTKMNDRAGHLVYCEK